MKRETSKHENLIKRGLRLHERFRYNEALRFFEEAFRLAPSCPAAIYNLANTLHMIDKEKEAQHLLSKLIRMSDTELAAGCPGLRQPMGFRNDALYLMFHVMLHWKRSWLQAFLSAQEHLRNRKRGYKTVWPLQRVRYEIAELREAFSRSLE